MRNIESEQALDVSLRSLGAVAQSDEMNDELDILVARIADSEERHAMETDRSVRPTTAKRPATTKWVIGLIAGALVVGGAVPATALMDWIARTGESAGDGTESHGGELIELTAPDVDGLINEMYPQWLPLPDAFSQSEAVGSVQATLQNGVNDPIANPGGGSVVMEDTGVLRQFESFALCGWLWEWRQANREGDMQARDHASSRIREATTWPALVKTDGGGIIERLVDTADGAAAGDTKAVSREESAQMCSTLLAETDAIRTKE